MFEKTKGYNWPTEVEGSSGCKYSDIDYLFKLNFYTFYYN